MIIILLNFLIAVITESYTEVASKQKIYTYVHKASLNEEVYNLVSYFSANLLPQYKVMVSSYNKEHTATNAIFSAPDFSHESQLFETRERAGPVTSPQASTDISSALSRLEGIIKNEAEAACQKQREVQGQLEMMKVAIQGLEKGQAEIKKKLGVSWLGCRWKW